MDLIRSVAGQAGQGVGAAGHVVHRDGLPLDQFPDSADEVQGLVQRLPQRQRLVVGRSPDGHGEAWRPDRAVGRPALRRLAVGPAAGQAGPGQESGPSDARLQDFPAAEVVGHGYRNAGSMRRGVAVACNTASSRCGSIPLPSIRTSPRQTACWTVRFRRTSWWKVFK